MKDVRKQPYRKAPGLVPQELARKEFNCPNCDTLVPVPWLEELKFPKQPVAPYTGGGHWVPASIPLSCPKFTCQKSFDVLVPSVPTEAPWTLYGDEAERFIPGLLMDGKEEDLHFFCITLVGLHKDAHERVRKKLGNLKKAIAPNRPPDTWIHHFTKIWDDDPESGQFALPSRRSKLDHARQFAKMIRSARPEMVTFNISGCVVLPKTRKNRKETIKHHKEEIFKQSILSTLHQMRKWHKSVGWVFDHIKDSTKGGKTEGWAEECFLGLQYTRLFTWLCSGATALPPRFVDPGSHYLLEVADFLSFWTAREFEKSVAGNSPEISTSSFGKGFYQATLGDGNVHYKWAKGLPLKEFYGLCPGNAKGFSEKKR